MARLLELSNENRLLDIPELNRFQIGDHVIVDESAENDRFEGVIIGIELRRVYGADRLEPSITLLHDGYITDEFKPIDCWKVEPSSPQQNVDATVRDQRSVAKLIYQAIGYHPDGKTEKPDGTPYGVWETALKAAAAVVTAYPLPQPNVEGGDVMPWLDIATAPRATEILVWNGRRRHVAHWDRVECAWVASFRTTTKRLEVLPAPTHWQPLPNAPALATTEDQQ